MSETFGIQCRLRCRRVFESDRITFTVTNNGRDLPRNALTSRGMGLQTMTYRAAVIGATLEVEAGSRGGAIVRCSLPKHSLGTPTRKPQ